MKYIRAKIGAIFIIGLLIGYSAGFYFGVEAAISLGLNFIDIDIDRDMIERAVFQYENQIGGCLFTEENAFIYNDTGY